MSNTYKYLQEGDYENAAHSYFSSIPGIGDAYGSARQTVQTDWWQDHGQTVHNVLDGAGFIPGPVGMAADGINVILYAAEGDYTNAGLSALAFVPVIGDAGAGIWKGSKLVAKYGDDVVGLTSKYGDDVVEGGIKQADEVFRLPGLDPVFRLPEPDPVLRLPGPDPVLRLPGPDPATPGLSGPIIPLRGPVKVAPGSVDDLTIGAKDRKEVFGAVQFDKNGGIEKFLEDYHNLTQDFNTIYKQTEKGELAVTNMPDYKAIARPFSSDPSTPTIQIKPEIPGQPAYKIRYRDYPPTCKLK